MIGTTRGERTIRAVALVGVLVFAALSLGSAVAAGWQHGTDAVSELESDPGTIDHSGGSSVGARAEPGPSKRDGAANDTDETRRTTDLEGTRASAEHTSGTGTADGASTERGARTTERGERTRSETTHRESTHREPTRTSEGEPTANATTGGTTADDPEADTPGAAGDRSGGPDRTLSTLRSGLWIIGGLGVLTTLFSLGGFVAAVLAYRGTD